MEINNEFLDGFLVLKLNGDIDAASSIILDNALDEALKSEHKSVLVDCTLLSYISSAGLGVFMSYVEDFKEKNKSLVLFGLSDKVRTVFSLLGLELLITMTTTYEEAKQLGDEL